MRYVALLFAVLCLLAPPTAAVATAAPVAGPPDRGAGDAAALATASFAEPRTEFVVSVRENRSARWTVTATFPFETEADRAAFEAYAARYEAGEAVEGPSAVVFRNAARAAANATGREMAIRRVNRTARLANESAGVLRLSFTWTEFVGSADGQLVLADVFRVSENTTWFRTLQSGQRLVIEPPAGYIPSDVSPPMGVEYEIQNRRIVITGMANLDAHELSIRYAPTQATTEPPNDWSTGELLAVALVGGGLLAAGAALLYRRGSGRSDGEAPLAGVNGNGSQPTDAGGASGSDANGSPTSPDEGAEGGGPSAGGPTEEELELLSDEERVERLLDRNGGRMRQAAIVKETGWSDAKVSQLLSAMAEEGRVEKLRLGRENLISLPDENGE